MEKVVRTRNLSTLRIVAEGGEARDVPLRVLCDRLGIATVIRVRSEELAEARRMQRLTHFNLQYSSHEVGKRYGLVAIVKPGYFTEEIEVPPLLAVDDPAIFVCVGVRHHVSYEALTPSDFAHSFSHIRGTDDLMRVMVERYARSMPDLSPAQILALGVSVTELERVSRAQA